jgi:hypothetical protein
MHRFGVTEMPVKVKTDMSMYQDYIISRKCKSPAEKRIKVLKVTVTYETI